MPDIIKIDRVCTMGLSKVLKEGEYILQIIAEVGIPPIVITNKKIYKTLFGSGVNIKNGERYDIENQVVEVFNFSVDNPIFQNTYKIVQNSDKTELKMLTYAIMTKLYSLWNIYNYLQNNWNVIYKTFNKNREEYSNLSETLPQIPFLKELFDAFCMETKDTISYFLTLFKVYYMKRDMMTPAVPMNACMSFIKSNNLLNIKEPFGELNAINEQFGQMRNAIVHIEDYETNSFLLYDVHLEKGNVLAPPMFEYKTKKMSGCHDVLEYVAFVYKSLLDISKQFLTTLV